MTRPANPLRGEAELHVGGVKLVVGIEFAGLAAYSAATGILPMNELLASLVTFNPRHALAALDCLTIEGDVAAAKAALSVIDEEPFRAAFSAALTDHIGKAEARKEQAPGNLSSP